MRTRHGKQQRLAAGTRADRKREKARAQHHTSPAGEKAKAGGSFCKRKRKKRFKTIEKARKNFHLLMLLCACVSSFQPILLSLLGF